MALFTGKADKKLPLLSQFYQLEINAPDLFKAKFDDANFQQLASGLIGSELDIWMGRTLHPEEGAEILYTENYASEIVERRIAERQAQGHERFNESEAGWFEDAVMLLGLIAKLHPHIKALMDGAADNWKLPAPENTGDVAKDAVQQVFHEAGYGSAISLRFGVHLDYLNARCKELKSSIRFNIEDENVTTTEWASHNVPLMASIIYQFKQGIEKKSLTHCLECRSVFLSKRSGAIYCSERCSNRVLKRKRRSEGKKE
jgi:hypothetical protein